MLLQWTTTLNFHNLALLIDRLFQNVSLDHSLPTYLGHGMPNHLLQVWGMVIEKQWLDLLIQMSMRIHLLVYICIPLSIPVSSLECILSILMNKLINLLHRFGLFICFIEFEFLVQQTFYSKALLFLGYLCWWYFISSYPTACKWPPHWTYNSTNLLASDCSYKSKKGSLSLSTHKRKLKRNLVEQSFLLCVLKDNVAECVLFHSHTILILILWFCSNTNSNQMQVLV